MIKNTDSSLIALYQNGSEKALEALINRHKKDLFTFIFYKINDEELANDVFQETFMKIILKLKSGAYSEEGKFLLWAKRIAHNLIIDHYRLRAKQVKVSETTFDKEDFSIFDQLASSEQNIEERLISEQINSDLQNLIIHLPENQQEVIKLRFFDNLSFKEIAEHTNTSINTTLGRVRYAVINMRKMMQEKNIILSR